MAEIISSLQVILIHDPVGATTQVLNSYVVGSDQPGDTRTRNGAETQRDVTTPELEGTLQAILNGLVTSAGTDAGI